MKTVNHIFRLFEISNKFFFFKKKIGLNNSCFEEKLLINETSNFINRRDRNLIFNHSQNIRKLLELRRIIKNNNSDYETNSKINSLKNKTKISYKEKICRKKETVFPLIYSSCQEIEKEQSNLNKRIEEKISSTSNRNNNPHYEKTKIEEDDFSNSVPKFSKTFLYGKSKGRYLENSVDWEDIKRLKNDLNLKINYDFYKIVNIKKLYCYK